LVFLADVKIERLKHSGPPNQFRLSSIFDYQSLEMLWHLEFGFASTLFIGELHLDH
jgi:hypothetical protein